ncbi:hypothetical protein EBB59_03445 [Lysobacter pythonis]|uniref:Relaxation protein n=1 Tax=Solilutibacter pythonis TaxID=2483112 RepID=A0A3M2I289_9GAMM|nr:hypothetical protein [Lysobacter pythonis]RMH93719.1 hypothetical protein EBB59_03445 [Lysobacter pythonis]
MQHDDPVKELRDMAAYLQKVTGQILTYQAQQKKYLEAQSKKHDQQIHSLSQAAQSVSGSAGMVVSTASRGIREQTRDAIMEGVGQAFGRIRDEANPALRELRDTTAGLAAERRHLAQDRLSFAWIGLACLGIGAVLAAIGSGTYSWAKLKEARQAEQTLGHLRALSALQIARCGENYCANVNLKEKIRHDGKTYYQIVPRPPE